MGHVHMDMHGGVDGIEHIWGCYPAHMVRSYNLRRRKSGYNVGSPWEVHRHRWGYSSTDGHMKSHHH